MFVTEKLMLLSPATVVKYTLKMSREGKRERETDIGSEWWRCRWSEKQSQQQN